MGFTQGYKYSQHQVYFPGSRNTRGQNTAGGLAGASGGLRGGAVGHLAFPGSQCMSLPPFTKLWTLSSKAETQEGTGVSQGRRRK